MCCFSGPVSHVANTRIFARLAKPGFQHLVYQMNVGSPDAVAMILPLPTPANTPENALTFHNLKEYEDLFDDLRRAFPVPRAKTRNDTAGVVPLAAAELKVEFVGDYVASFVPSVADFGRLNKRFQLPAGTWDKLPAYRDYGFAVFQLAKGDGERHPMAFTFPTRLAADLFFPTVHIHDGEVHKKAEFDHTLYAQTPEGLSPNSRGWEESPGLAGTSVKCVKTKGIIDPAAHLHRQTLRGNLKNEDLVVALD